MKKRILVVGDSSLYGTGFGNFSYEILSGLHKTNKYELAEFAVYGSQKEEINTKLKWDYYGNKPQNSEERKIFKSKISNQFGEWKFNQVCLSFKPDIVLSVNGDVWMWDYIQKSPAREYFYHAVIATVDAEPEKDSHLASYKSVDGLFCYSDYGVNLLKSNGLNTLGRVSPTINQSLFFPSKNKRDSKKILELPENSFIVGSVMRNQKRKLFPDLINSFKLFLKKTHPEIAQKSYLYLHTYYPDVGWDIPNLIKNSGIGHRIYFTWHCAKCSLVYADLYHDNKSICKYCNHHALSMPNYEKAINGKCMGEIYRAFDCYVQYAQNEGFGIPILEAAASGLPFLAPNYSAMADLIDKLEGYPIKIRHYLTENVTNFLKVVPDDNDAADILTKLSSMSEQMRSVIGFKNYELSKKYYNPNKTISRLVEYIDSIEPLNKWNQPPKFGILPQSLPDFTKINNSDFVTYCLTSIANRPDLVDSYAHLKILRDLDCEEIIEDSSFLPEEISNKKTKFTRDMLFRGCVMINDAKNEFEKIRGIL